MKYVAPDRPRAGVVAALSALRSEASPAAGEFPDLVLLGELASSWGFGLVQLLPVNDSGTFSSPYMALSAFALHPLYIRIGDLVEAAAAPELLSRARRLAEGQAGAARLDYFGYSSRKLDLLEELFRTSVAGRDPEAWLDSLPGYGDWLRANPWLRAYAVFSQLKRREGNRPWWEWEAERDADEERIGELWADPALRAGTRFFAWLQFRAADQFRRAAEALAARGVELLGDIPILVGRDSADVWSNRGIFRLDLSAGSPPDWENPRGQNWGFPAYDWAALEARDLDFWKDRLALASRFYSAYRIDHVLGFFRLWTCGVRSSDAWLGSFRPGRAATREELAGLGFDPARIRWLSQPHLPYAALLAAAGGNAEAVSAAIGRCLARIGGEELFLFKDGIGGELDLREALADLPHELGDFLRAAWSDRALVEVDGGFARAWGHRETTAWRSLSEEERRSLDLVFEGKARESEALHEATGRRLLSGLLSASDMLATAEDLGGIPPYVPGVLDELGIFGLRVWRWTRRWHEEGQPFVEAADYPRRAVACSSVHDSSALREWWEREADRKAAWAFCASALGSPLGEAPDRLTPAAARILNSALASTAALLAVFPIQDLLGMGAAYRPADAREERVNVPGTDSDWNWGYRLPATLEELLRDGELGEAARGVAAHRSDRASPKR